ncbi:MAG: MFS transporter [Pseudomonadota bacterium]
MSTPIVKLSFAASGIAQGVISNGVSYFLLIYYSQVLGLDPGLAGLAMMISLMVDAISDPMIGVWSDRLRSRFGRRHPFLFTSILPITAAYVLLWDVPELSQWGLFAYLLLFTVLLRLSLTLHIVPFNALLPQLSSDYEVRTSLMSYSYSGAWFVGTLLAVMMYAYWLADAPGGPVGNGMQNIQGYVEAGWIAGLIAFACLLLSALGTYRSANRHHRVEVVPPVTGLGQLFVQSRETLNDRNFLAMVLSGLAGAIASGSSTALWAYMQPYFWGFNSDETGTILAAQLLSAIFAFVLIPILMKGREKRLVLICVSALSMVIGSGPALLRLLDLFPQGGTDLLFYTMVVVGVIQVMFIVITSTVTASMIADIVEARALKTGRREEGLLFAVVSFISKVASGAGIWVGGVMLVWVEFPTDVWDLSIADASVRALGWAYGLVLGVLYLLSLIALFFYRLTRSDHQANVSQLRAGQ